MKPLAKCIEESGEQEFGGGTLKVRKIITRYQNRYPWHREGGIELT